MIQLEYKRGSEKSYPLRKLTTIYFENHVISCITITARVKKSTFCERKGGKFITNLAGRIVEKAWKELPILYPACRLGNYSIKPDEIIGIITLDNSASNVNTIKLLPIIISDFKARTTKLLNQYHYTLGRIFWENNYKEKPINNLNDLSEALNIIGVC